MAKPRSSGFPKFKRPSHLSVERASRHLGKSRSSRLYIQVDCFRVSRSTGQEDCSAFNERDHFVDPWLLSSAVILEILRRGLLVRPLGVSENTLSGGGEEVQ